LEDLNKTQPQAPAQKQIGGQPVAAPPLVVAPHVTTAPPASGAQPAKLPSTGGENAGFWQRFVAWLIDGFIWGIIFWWAINHFGLVFVILAHSVLNILDQMFNLKARLGYHGKRPIRD